jgi:hypothetical protein
VPTSTPAPIVTPPDIFTVGFRQAPRPITDSCPMVHDRLTIANGSKTKFTVPMIPAQSSTP